MAQDDAASLLVRFMLDDKVPFVERRRCAEFLLNYEDRNKVEVTLAAWHENIQELFFDDGLPDPEIIDGVLVENEPRALPASDRPTPSDVLGPEDSEPSWSRPGRYRNR